MKPPEHIQKAIQAHYAERITDEQLAELEAWFREDEANIRHFAELGMVEWHMMCEREKQDATSILIALREAEENAEPDFSLLHTPTAFTSPAASDSKPMPSIRELASMTGSMALMRLRTKAGVIGSIAALLVLSAVLYLSIFGLGNSAPSQQEVAQDTPGTPAAPEIQPATVVATLTGERDAVWDRHPGDDLYAGQRLTLTQGFAEVTTRRGAVAIIEAPAKIEFLDNPNALQLHAGKLFGICETESSKGFLVRTPHLDVTDLGTRFGVDASTYEATEVHVYDGEVVVARQSLSGLGGPVQYQRLVQGEAVRTLADSQDLVAIEPTFGHFATAPGVYELPGTGYGEVLNQGRLEQNWRLAWVNQERLRQRVDLVESTPPNLSTLTPNVPGKALWLKLENPEQYQGNEQATYKINAFFTVPEGIDLDKAVLHIDFHVPDGIDGAHFDAGPYGRWDAIDQGDNGKASVAIPMNEISVRPGLNFVNFLVTNDPGTELYFYMAWRIEIKPDTVIEGSF